MPSAHRRLPAMLGPGRRAAHLRRVTRRLLAVVALCAALLVIHQATMPPQRATRTAVLVATDLPAGHTLTTKDLAPVPVPRDLPLVTLSSAQELVGRQLARAVVRATALSQALLIPRSVAEGLPAGTVALHVTAGDARILDLLAPGTTVRLHRVDSGAEVARGVRVLSVDPAPSGTWAATGSGPRGLVVALPSDSVGADLLVAGADGAQLVYHVIPESAGA